MRDHVAQRVLELSQVSEVPDSVDNDGVPLESIALIDDPQWNRFSCLKRELLGRISAIFAIALSVLILVGIAWFLGWKHYSLSLSALGLWLVLTARTFVYPFLEIPRRGYAFSDFDITYVRGVIAKERTVIPLAKVQHVESNSGWIDRRFGLANFSIQTPASEISMVGLEIDEAEALRDRILERAKELGSAVNTQNDDKSNTFSIKH